MILQQLERDYERILRYGSLAEDEEEDADSGSPSMYDRKPVRWKLMLDNHGGFEGFGLLSGGGKKDKGLPEPVPSLVRTVNVRPLLFADTPAYVLGTDLEDGHAARKHAAFRALAESCDEAVSSPATRAVVAFLRWWDGLEPEDRPSLPPEITKSDLITFDVEGVWPIRQSSVRRFWAACCDESRSASEPKQCLVCGEVRPAVESMPFMLKGLPGGQTSGTALVSANSDAFESYGLRRATTSPICAPCAERFSKSLKALLAGESTHKRIGPLVYVFWTAAGPSLDLAKLSRPEPDWVKSLIESYREGRPYSLEDETAFYAVVLSASVARAVVRDWLTTTVGRVRQNLARWFALQRVTDAFGQEGRPLADWQLAASIYRKADDVEARITLELMRSALHGEPLPVDLLHRAVLRNRAARDVTYERAALITAVLRSQQDGRNGREESTMTDLEERITEGDASLVGSVKDRQARLLGRLLATLEELQRAQADTKITATLVDRFYGAASSAPGTVFGTLLADAQNHLAKLRKKNEPAHGRLQRQMEEIQDELYGLGDMPTTLTLRQQALFSLGYYHQRAAMRAATKEAAAAKRARATTGAAVDDNQADQTALDVMDDTDDQED